MSRAELGDMAARLTRRAQLVSVLLLGCASLAIAADKTAQLSDEFLEYLGSLEGDDDSWMDFAADAAVKESAKPPTKTGSDSKQFASSSSSSSRLQSLPQAASTNTSAASQAGKVEK